MHPTRRSPWLVVVAAITFGTTAMAGTPPDTARRELGAAIHAMGGATVLHHIGRVHLKAHAYRNMLEQSERPDGPWIPAFSHIEQWVDFSHDVVRTRVSDRPWGPPMETLVVDGVAARTIRPGTKQHKTRPGRRASASQARLRMALGPERVLLTALAATDLHVEPMVTLQHVPQKVLAFTWHQSPVRLYLNAWTSLPTAVEITRAHPWDFFWNLWGDVTTRTWYSFWVLKPGGLRYPKQWDIQRNGQHARTVLIDTLTLNPPPPDKSPSIPETVRKAFHKQRMVDAFPLRGKAVHVAPGVVLLPGAWNTVLVAQSDGIVVLDAPIASGYSHQVMQKAKALFPDRPIKALVTTSNAWPHVGGLREYVAKQVPLYVLDLNVPFVKDVLEAPHTLRPDTLARHPQAPRLHAVADKTVIGTGADRIVLYPVRGEAGERMLLAYLPEQKLLYASDLVQPKPDGGFAFPEYLLEVAHVVAREGLEVERVVAMHTPQTLPWKTLRDAIAKAEAPD